MRKLALVTGGTSGIGLAAARELSKECDLALVHASNHQKAEAAKLALEALCAETEIRVYPQILTDENDCALIFNQVVKDFGRAPNILINSAGRLQDGLLLASDFSVWKTVIAEHLLVSMALCQLAAKKMTQAKWGRIVNLSSISAQFAKRGQANYAAAKAGLEAFSRTFALEVAHRGVTVNCVAPGLIETPMTETLIENLKQKDEPLRNRIPAGRLGTAHEVACLIGYLCSDDAAYITGISIAIDGGRSLGDPRS